MPIITTKFDLDSAYLATVLGPADDNLRVLGNLVGVDLFARGTTVTAAGPEFEVARARKVLEELEAIARRGHPVSKDTVCLLYTSPSPRDRQKSRMPSSA